MSFEEFFVVETCLLFEFVTTDNFLFHFFEFDGKFLLFFTFILLLLVNFLCLLF